MLSRKRKTISPIRIGASRCGPARDCAGLRTGSAACLRYPSSCTHPTGPGQEQHPAWVVRSGTTRVGYDNRPSDARHRDRCRLRPIADADIRWRARDHHAPRGPL